MATKPAALHAAGIIRHLHPDPSTCVQRPNVNRQKLLAFARSLATFVGLSPKQQFALTNRGESDVSLFDFTAKRQCDLPCRCLESGGTRLHVHLVGDSAIGPFWPLGTGSNRAVLGAYDAVHAMTRFAALSPRAGASDVLEVLQEQEAIYLLLKQSSSSNLRSCGREQPSWRIDPLTRYKVAALPTLPGRLSAHLSHRRPSSVTSVDEADTSEEVGRASGAGGQESGAGRQVEAHEIWDDEQSQSRAVAVRPRRSSFGVDYVVAMGMAAGMGMGMGKGMGVGVVMGTEEDMGMWMGMEVGSEEDRTSKMESEEEEASEVVSAQVVVTAAKQAVGLLAQAKRNETAAVSEAHGKAPAEPPDGSSERPDDAVARDEEEVEEMGAPMMRVADFWRRRLEAGKQEVERRQDQRGPSRTVADLRKLEVRSREKNKRALVKE